MNLLTKIKFVDEEEKVEVPTPPSKGKISQEKKLKSFKRPKDYIVYDQRPYSLPEVALEYDMDEEDEKWICEYNKNTRVPLSELNFERIYALLQRLDNDEYVSILGVYRLSKLCRTSKEDKILEHHVYAVRDYWKQKTSIQRSKENSTN